MKTILELSYDEAKQYFLKQESYCSIDLPKYFVFQNLLDELAKKIGDKKINDFFSPMKPNNPKGFEGVNYTFFTNKDGKFAWRPLQLINPAIYVFLVHKITEENNWNLIVERFKEFKENPQINCCSIPILSEEENKSDKAQTVTNWWNTIEQQSLELALDYNYLLSTDITDCYGSIYTHSIPWALHEKEVVKADHSPDIYIGNRIDVTIQSMSNGQTNGIPQGSVLMDFIAEMVLSYADMLLSKKIDDAKIVDYQILRYRDDYRIFTNNQEDVVKIAKLLTETLIGLNLKLNTQKTFVSNNIIRDAIKPDKLYWIGAKKGEKTLQKTLYLIYELSEKYPNSGSLTRTLSDFQKRLYKRQKIDNENIRVLISIIVDIAYKNPKTYPMATAILSKLLSLLNDTEIVNRIISSIERKFDKIPNVGYLQIWLQRLTVKINPDKDYDEKLCQKVVDEQTDIWNIDWLNGSIRNIFNSQSIIDWDYISNMEEIISPEEVQLFEYIK